MQSIKYKPQQHLKLVVNFTNKNTRSNFAPKMAFPLILKLIKKHIFYGLRYTKYIKNVGNTRFSVNLFKETISMHKNKLPTLINFNLNLIK